MRTSSPATGSRPNARSASPSSPAGWAPPMAAERAEPLILWAWWREFSRAIYGDELGEALRGNWLARAPFLTAVLTARGGQARWCDDVRTRPVESCDAMLAAG